MTSALTVAAAVVLVDVTIARLAATGSWLSRSPALGIVVWQALTVSFVLSCVAASAVLAAPLLLRVSALEGFMHACAPLLDQPYTSVLGLGVGAVGTAFLILLIARLGYSASKEAVVHRASCRKHRRDLNLVSRHDPRWNVSVIDHPSSAAYCLPGKPGSIVVTAGALDVLDDDQIEAVIAHERAHLHGHHGWVLAAARVAARALPRLQLARTAQSEIITLVEMRADQIALRSSHRSAMAQALVHLSAGTVPAGMMGAGGSAVARLERLAHPGPGIPRHQAVLAQAAVIALVLAPLLMATFPFAQAVWVYCGTAAG
jgi:Zn-dependent protease with chaperone function